MKIRYEFATETVEIEVDDEIGTIITELDRQDYNTNRKETRRHCFLDALDYEGECFAFNDEALAALFEDESPEDKLPGAIAKLQPQQRELLYKVLNKKEKLVDIAKSEGVSKAAISRRMDKIYSSLKKYLL